MLPRYTMAKGNVSSRQAGKTHGGRRKVVSMNRPVRTLVVGLCLAAVTSGLALSQTARPHPTRARRTLRPPTKQRLTTTSPWATCTRSWRAHSATASDYTNKAIEHYRQAMKLDASAAFLSEELTDLYIQAGRIKDAVTEAEDLLKQEPQQSGCAAALGPDLRAADR